MRKMSDYVDTNPPTTDTPNGTFKNETQPNAADGTDIKAEHMQDPYYALYQILQLAGEIPNGDLENGTTNRQFLKSLTSIGWFKYDSNIEYKKNAIVIHTIDSATKLYRSQKDNNNSPLTNTDLWTNILTINSDNTVELNNTLTDNTGVFIGAFMYGIRNDTPEGWLRCDGNEYPSNAFKVFIDNFLLTGKIPYKNLTDWQTEYNANNGNCGYFGYQEEIIQYQEDENGNKTNMPVLDEDGNPIVIQQGILKTPCLQDRVFIAQALNSGNIAKFNWDQIINITGLVLTGEDRTKANPNGAFYVSGVRAGGCNNESEVSNDVSFDASRVVRTGDKVQPQHIQYPLFICVSNRPVPATEAQYNSFIDAITNKLSIDGSNATLNALSKPAKQNIINCLIPIYTTRISVPNGYVCQYYCYVWFRGAHTGSAQNCYINGISIGTLNQDVYGANHYAKDNAYAFCKPGDTIVFDNGTCYIYKLNGAI